jgi:predicted ATPase
MGVHTGEAQERQNDYFGPAVNRAARIMGRARGGQILVSLTTAELVRDQLASEIEFVDLGEHRLASLQRAERVFQVAARGLRTGFPPLSDAEDQPKGNVTRAATTFVGRTAELKWLTVHLPARPLITITGPGGVGKSRLAIEAAVATADAYPDGVWFVDLAPATDPASVASIAAATLDVRERLEASLLATLVESVRSRRMLIILDNCEHVIDAAAELASAAVATCPGITTLATSRTPLGLASEEVWPIAPLDSDEDIVRLFEDRARAADARYDVGDDQDVVGAIGRKLDGMPLAIELAAARIRSMAPAEILGRLDERFRLLRAGGRDRVERHQTLRATIDWSYQLLTRQEQLLFDRLSVMAATFAVEDAEAVCSDDDLAAEDIPDLLAELVDKSMVVAERTGSGTRFRELETLRQYGAERLAERDDPSICRRRHLAHYCSLALAASQRFEGTENERGANDLDSAWNNIRTALYVACADGDGGAAVVLLESTFYYSFFGLRYEHGDWAQRILESVEFDPVVTGIVAYWRSFASLDDAINVARRGIARAANPEGRDTLYCWIAVLCAALYAGHVDEAVDGVQAAERIARAVGSPFALAQVLAGETNVVASVDPGRALACALEAQQVADTPRNRTLAAWTETSVGVARSVMGDAAGSAACYREALDWASSGMNRLVEMQVPLWLAVRSPASERPQAYGEVLSRLYAHRQWNDLHVAIESIAAHWADTGRSESAAVLLGHLEVHGRGHGAMARRRARLSSALSATHGQDMARGAAMNRDELVEYALSELQREATEA